MRKTQRERREVGPRALKLLSPFFRYSYSREAYILRAVGQRRGPVLRERVAQATQRKDRLVAG